MNENGQLNVNADEGVLANDTDDDGDPLEAVLGTEPGHGTLALEANGSFTYTPDEDYDGTDTFTYYATDGRFASAIPGDLDGDGAVNSSDLDRIRANWGQSVTPGDLAAGDANENGSVNSDDLDVVRANWGEQASPSTSTETTVTITIDRIYDPGTTYIEFSGNSISVTGSGAVVDGSTVTVTSDGTYNLSGTLNDGRVIVDTDDSDDVILILDGVNITCSDNAPIFVVNASDAVIRLADGTENFITDGDTYTYPVGEDEPDAAIYSKDDLVIEGGGSLIVDANFKHGIASRDDIDINGGTITVTAQKHGILGRDSVVILDGNISINAGSDGIQSNNDSNPDKGYITIEGGTIEVTAGSDGVQAETTFAMRGGDLTVAADDDAIHAGTSAAIIGGNLDITASYEGIDSPAVTIDNATIDIVSTNDAISATSDDGSSTVSIYGGSLTIAAGTEGIQAEAQVFISGGTLDITTGGGSTATLPPDASAKALRADVDLVVTGGIITIDSADDAVHSEGTVAISGGDFTLATGDDGIHGDTAVTIDGGTINVTRSSEGIESNHITINEGTIHVVSSDDGLNIAGGVDGTEPIGTIPDAALEITGGYIAVYTEGDGCDSNGSVYISGGTLIVHGPTGDTYGALDYNGVFEMTGGFLVAVGSADKAQSTSPSSTQETLAFSYGSMQSAGTMIHIATDGGEEILTFMPAKAYQNVVLSSAELATGTTYVVYSGGTSSGTQTDGLYSGGTYTPRNGTRIHNALVARKERSAKKAIGIGSNENDVSSQTSSKSPRIEVHTRRASRARRERFCQSISASGRTRPGHDTLFVPGLQSLPGLAVAGPIPADAPGTEKPVQTADPILRRPAGLAGVPGD